MRILKTTAIFTTLFAALAFGAGTRAAPIIFDSFTGPNGNQLDPASSASPQPQHFPDVNTVPGAAYINQNGAYNVALSGNTVGLGIDQGTGISIQSSAPYVKPTDLIIAADISFGDVTGDDYPTRLIGLGFMNTLVQNIPDGYGPAGFGNFQGLVIQPNGNLALMNTYGGNVLQAISYAGTFNPAIFHSLSYRVYTATGGIGEVLYDGTPYSFTGGLSTLTDPNTKFAGFYVSGSSGTTAFIDNFSIRAVPEPTSFALLLSGLIGFSAIRRRK